MRLIALACLLLASATARQCGTEIVSDEVLAGVRQLQKTEQNLVAGRSIAKRGDLPAIKVPLYFHTVSAPGNESMITDASLEAQVEVLVETFAEYDIQLDYKGIASRTVDAYFSEFPYPVTSQERVLFNSWRTATRKGGYDSLNIYFYTNMLDGFWGSCNLPRTLNYTYNQDRNLYWEDACNLHGATVPGGRAVGFNQGKSAVHEVGHWFGLLHVFMGYICGPGGDLVDDTPEQSTSTVGCPVGKDSCPDAPGLDSIHNFMDYSGDLCYEEFTPGQKLRMHSSWAEFRANPPPPPA